MKQVMGARGATKGNPGMTETPKWIYGRHIFHGQKQVTMKKAKCNKITKIQYNY